ncbi:hypothetical protein ACH5RR_023682 [Cinchona calisaya]|uniref:Uncharacterized protein n=1 Tax=Cinchona calisaya TaxID=153742 RepID=A0ABD2ZES9_9GENT
MNDAGDSSTFALWGNNGAHEGSGCFSFQLVSLKFRFILTLAPRRYPENLQEKVAFPHQQQRKSPEAFLH